MPLFLINILLAFVWLFLSAELNSKNFIFGFVVCYFVLWVAFRKSANSTYFQRGPAMLTLTIFFIKEVVLSGFEVAWDVVFSGKDIQPGIISIKTEVTSDLELVSLSGLITLTPGNLVLEYEEEKKLLYVHLINANKEEDARKSIQIFEEKVKKVFG